MTEYSYNKWSNEQICHYFCWINDHFRIATISSIFISQKSVKTYKMKNYRIELKNIIAIIILYIIETNNSNNIHFILHTLHYNYKIHYIQTFPHISIASALFYRLVWPGPSWTTIWKISCITLRTPRAKFGHKNFTGENVIKKKLLYQESFIY